MTIPVSILVLTKNEEQDLQGCLDSVSWSDDIHVYDSLSEDQTVKIAENFGAKVTKREFDNWSAHQNWGLENLSFKYSWIFYIDADERMTTELKQSIQKAVNSDKDIVAYRVQRRDFFMGTWLKHVQTSPYYIRLFQPEKVHYERLVNPVTITDGRVDDIGGYLDHYPFSKGITHWLDRHNSYSTFEAEQIIEGRRTHESFSIKKAFLCADFNEKRLHQKELFYRLPLRPVIKFFLLYILKLGFLDGRAGLTYAILQSIYEYMIALKTREMELVDQKNT